MMSALRFPGQLLLAAALYAQPPSLALSRVTAAPDGTAVLELSYTSVPESPVAALQWTFQYPADAVTGITVEDGPAVTGTGKTVICLSDAVVCKCLALGANADTIPDGVVAKVAFLLTPGTKEAVILVSNTLGASQEGQPVPVRGENGTISAGHTTPRRGVPARFKRASSNK
jgi:hypothetical protein